MSAIHNLDCSSVFRNIVALVYRRVDCSNRKQCLPIHTIFIYASVYRLHVSAFPWHHQALLVNALTKVGSAHKRMCFWILTFTNICNVLRYLSPVVQRGVLYSGCKIFNNLPTQIKSHFENLRNFKKILKNYLVDHSLYSLEEYYYLTV